MSTGPFVLVFDTNGALFAAAPTLQFNMSNVAPPPGEIWNSDGPDDDAKPVVQIIFILEKWSNLQTALSQSGLTVGYVDSVWVST